MSHLKLQFPDSFYKEETRNGYIISTQMKKVWAVELDLLARFLEACRKYNLKCFADAGTLLGAVRHRGMIPWDDDIDLVMFREDYDKMVTVADAEFEKPYFFQNVYSDTCYDRGHAQFRNSETTGMLSVERDMGCRHNMGIFIDIFVLDGVTDNCFLLEMQKIKIMLKKKLIYHCIYADRASNYWKHKICKVIAEIGWKGKYKEIFKSIENNLRRYSVHECELVAPLNFIFETKKRIRNKHFYDQEIWLDFENIKVPAPANFHEFLTTRYGDYMKPVQVSTTHGEVFFDVDRPYTDYMERRCEK